MSPRRVAALVLASGVILGTASDRLSTRAPQRLGDYWLLAGDFHVHAFPGDGTLAPWRVRREAARAALDVVAITNHNQTIAGRLAVWASQFTDGPIVISGEEITNPTYHMIAVGVTSEVDAGQPAVDAIVDVHRQGGVAIAAHPSPRYTGWDAAALAALDGSERAHAAMHTDETFQADLATFFERARSLNPGLAPIGASDFHGSPALARCRTLLFARERSAAGVIDAIRSGRTVAMDANGRMYGDPDLVRQAEGARLPRRADDYGVWDRVSVALAWLGALGMVILRGRGA